MKQNLKQNLITGGGKVGTILADYALELNGTDEYLSIALPDNELLASAGVTDFYSSGSAIAGWTEAGTVAWAGTTAGKTYTNTIVGGDGASISKTISGLIVGQKYKLKLRFQSDGEFFVSGGTTEYFNLGGSAGEWNTVSKIFTATSIIISFYGSVGWVLDYASVKRDLGFDANKDQEQILHSRNALFNNAGTDWVAKDVSSNQQCALSTVDKSEGTGSLLITSTGVGDATDHYVTLPPEFLESCLEGKKYTIQGDARLDPASLTYGVELFTSFQNTSYLPFETFTTAANEISSAINTTTEGWAWIDNITNCLTTEIYKITFDLVLNSGVAPSFRLFINGGSGSGGCSNTATSANGANTLYLIPTSNVSNVDVVTFVQSASNFAITNFSVKKANAITLTARLGTKSVTSSALSIVAGTFTKFVLNFEATAGEQSQDLKLYLSGAGSVFVDKLSLTQRFDMIAIKKFKASDITSGKYFLSVNMFYDFLLTSKQWIQSAGVGETTITNNGINLNTTSWWNIITQINHTNLIVTDGTNNSSVAFNSGKQTSVKLVIGATSTGASPFAGQISHLQIWRFENIALSTFNSAIKGLQYPTGGGAEEVLRLTFQSGVNITECLKDYSPKAHTVTGINIDISNRKKVTT